MVDVDQPTNQLAHAACGWPADVGLHSPFYPLQAMAGTRISNSRSSAVLVVFLFESTAVAVLALNLVWLALIGQNFAGPTLGLALAGSPPAPLAGCYRLGPTETV